MLSIIKNVAMCVVCLVASDKLLTIGANYGGEAFRQGKEVYNKKKSAK
jgi:hypothetical protein